MWWTKEKIDFYIQAAKHSDFHEYIGNLITPHLSKEDRIQELGCGLGFLTSDLTRRGFKITGIDEDVNAIEKAGQLFPSCAFSCQDAYKASKTDVSIAMFFGRIMQAENLEKLLSSCSKKLIYIANEHNRAENPDFNKSKEIASFLGMKDVKFTCDMYMHSFNQVCKTRAEAEDFLQLTYKDKNAISIVRSEDDSFPYLIPINKAFGLFIIEKENIIK